jgi:transcriptional regulator with XRE-family HTH domain
MPAALDTARLRAARERAGLTQVQASGKLGLAKGAFGDWERGEKAPALENFVDLCRLLDVSADYLLKLDPPPAAGAARLGPGRRAGPLYPDLIVADERYPHGLRALADSRSHQAALRIAPAEWTALASLDAPDGLSRDGYIGLLVLLRAAAVRHTYTRAPSDAPDAYDPRGEALRSGVGEPDATVHEHDGPGYPPRR